MRRQAPTASRQVNLHGENAPLLENWLETALPMREATPSQLPKSSLPHPPFTPETTDTLKQRPQGRDRDERKLAEPGNSTDALMKPKSSAAAPMSMPPPPASQLAAPAMPRVPVPLDELLKIANEFLEGGRLPEAEKLLDHIISAVPNSKGGRALSCRPSSSRGRNGRVRHQAVAGSDQFQAQPVPDL